MSRALERTLRRLATAPPAPDEATDLERCAALRDELLARGDEVGDVFEALGGTTVVRVGAEAAGASVPAVEAVLLYRLVRLLRPRRVVELGSAFGVSGAHLASALAAEGCGELVTIEGSPSRHEIAAETIERAAAGVTTALCGFFEDHLDALGGAGLVFVDGNHQVEPTLGYVDEVVARAARPCALVLDDVDWSPEFARMWRSLRRDGRFTAAGGVAGLGVLLLGETAALRGRATRWASWPRPRSRRTAATA